MLIQPSQGSTNSRNLPTPPLNATESQRIFVGSSFHIAGSWGSWLWRHGEQIAKGGAALVGLVALGSIGYFARGLLGKSAGNAAKPSGNHADNASAEEGTLVLTSQDSDLSGDALISTSSRASFAADGTVDFSDLGNINFSQKPSPTALYQPASTKAIPAPMTATSPNSLTSATSNAVAPESSKNSPESNSKGVVTKKRQTTNLQNTASYTLFPAVIELSSLDGTNGFKLNGEAVGDVSGNSVSAAGDINGDGIDDLLIGACCASPSGIRYAGSVYVVFGSRNGFPSSFELSSLNGSNGFKLNGEEANDYSGRSVSTSGDINGDGIADLLIGAYQASPSGRRMAGSTYVVFGSRSAFSSNFDLSSLNGTNGFKLNGVAAYDYSGNSVSAAGDINGDGIDDLLIGAYGAYQSSAITAKGCTYVVFGSRSVFPSSFELSSLNGTNGFKLNGETGDDSSGISVSAVGDINGDGIDDLLIGAYDASPSGRNHAGNTYVVFGSRNGFPSSIELSSLNGTNGFKMNGEVASDYSGYSVSAAGDINGDGIADLLIGAYVADPSARRSAGSTYVVFGSRNGFPSSLELSSLNGTNGFKLNGEAAADFSGCSVSAAGDINGDGIDDLLIGAYGADPSERNYAGSTYVVFGSRNGFPSSIELSSLNGTNGFKMNGEAAGDYSGYSVSAAGDINGDGIADLLIGAYRASPSGRGNAGSTYVVFGRSSNSAPVLTANQLSILQGQAVILSTANLNASDAEQSAAYLSFTVSNVKHGRFERVSAPDTTITNFTLEEVQNSQIRFVHDGSVIAPNYQVAVSDGMTSIAESTATIVFTNVPASLGIRSIFPAVIELSSLNGTNGFKLNGEAAYDYSGMSVSAAGDINGDGVDDLLIGALYASPLGRDQAGSTYVVFGSRKGFPGSFDLSSLNGTNGFKLNGVALDRSGYFVSAAGDINGDGIDDLLIGSPCATPSGRHYAGKTYVVFGSRNAFPSSFDLSSLNGTNGFDLSGEAADDQSGHSVSAAGDINGDGIDDLLIGSPYAAPFGRSHAGSTYVVFGSRSVFPSSIELSSLNGTNGFKLNGEATWDRSGYSVSVAGDINGDGIADLLIGAPIAAPFGRISAGSTYVIFGSRSVFPSSIELSSLNGTNGFKLNGEAARDQSGKSVSSAGDINEDGIDDLLIGGYGQNLDKGRSYVVFGSRNGFPSNFELSSLNGANGFKLNGEQADDQSGRVRAAGDINGDGIDDFLIGASGASPLGRSQAGSTYVVFGSRKGFPGSFDLSSLNGTNGFKLNGEKAKDCSGISVSAAGDINGDGIADLLIGVPTFIGSGQAGSTYVVFGSALELVRNQLTIHRAETLFFDNNNLYASRAGQEDLSLIYNIDGLQHGRFEMVSAPGVGISSFNQSLLWSQQVRFVHDGSEIAPAYQVQVNSEKFAYIPATSAKITFIDNPPQLLANQLNLHRCDTLLLNRSNLNATRSNQEDLSLLFSISGFPHGRFELTSVPGSAITSFYQSQVWNQQVQFVHDCTIAPAYQIQVNATQFPYIQPVAANVTFFADPPQLLANKLNLHRCGIVPLNSAYLRATDVRQGEQGLMFYASDVMQGRFEYTNNPGTALTGFNQSAVINSRVQFAHGCSITAPSYKIQVGEPVFPYIPPTSANITAFYIDLPVVANNALTLDERGIANITSSTLSAYDPTAHFSDTDLIFNWTNLQHGYFAAWNDMLTALNRCSQQEVKEGRIIFVHDRSRLAPSYNTTVSDGYAYSASSAATIHFSYMPHLIHNSLHVNEGRSTILTSDNLSASDPDSDITQLIFSPSNIQRGHFEYLNGTAVSAFRQWEVANQKIQFTHVGGITAPGYMVSVSDGRLSEEAQTANITFNQAPILLLNKLDIYQSQAVIFSASNLRATDAETAAENLLFIVSGADHGHFENTATGEMLSNFTQNAMTKSSVQFVHDGGVLAPFYNISVSDGLMATVPRPAEVTFRFAASFTFLNNQLNIYENQARTLTTSNLEVSNPAGYAPDEIVFTISSLQHGSFEYVNDPSISIETFSRRNITDAGVNFVHDGSKIRPSYSVEAVARSEHIMPTAAVIYFTNLPPILVTNQLKIREAETIILTTDNFDAVDKDIAAKDISFTITSLQHGTFKCSGRTVFSFTLEEINNRQISFTHDGSEFAPSYNVAVSNGIVSSDSTAAQVDFTNLPPTIVNNKITIKEGERITLGLANLYATDTGTTAMGITYNITNLQHGHFEKTDPLPSTVVTSFTQEDINFERIVFIHDFSKFAPSYAVIASDGYVSSNATTVTIEQYKNLAPTLTANKIALNQGQNLTLSATNFNAVDIDPSIQPAAITFTVSNVQYGRFANKTAPSSAITSFTLQDIQYSKIIFIHDGSKNKPSYTVAVSDGYETDPVTAQDGDVQYNNLAPSITANQITLNQGQRITLTTTNFNATDLDTSLPFSSIIFTVSNVQHGQFENATLPGTPITSFTLKNIQDGQVQFVHDNSKIVPSYSVVVSDGTLSSSLSQGNVVYTNLPPILITNKMILKQGYVVFLTIANLNAECVGSIAPEAIIFIVDEVQHGRFESTTSPGTAITSFTLKDINDAKIIFIHDKSKQKPSYKVAIYDGYLVTTPVVAVIQYSNLPPTLHTNQITLNESETIILGPGNFNATAIEPSVQPMYVTFTLDNVKHGRFESRVSGMEIASFSMQDILDSRIQFVHDRSKKQPEYSVTVSDGSDSASKQGEVKYKNLPPIITANQMAVVRGEALLLTTNNLNANDTSPSITPDLLVFTVSDVRYGQFENITSIITAINNFTLQNIIDSKIRFMHDGNSAAPTYSVAVSDGYVSSSTVNGMVVFRLPGIFVPQVLSTGAIVGIASGASAALLLLAGGVFLFWRRSKRQQNRSTDEVDMESITYENIRFIKKIGRGGFSDVFLGSWQGAQVAVKVINDLSGLSPETLKEFNHELEIMKRLRHPNVVQFFGGTIDLKRSKCYLVMEFMSLGSLTNVLADRKTYPLSWQNRMKMMLESATGVQYLHSLHPPIIHRDIKSLNFLVSADRTIKISDFGTSKITQNNRNTTTAMTGTPLWSAPETLHGQTNTEKSDIFSLGMVLWEILTRRLPFEGEPMITVIMAVVMHGKREIVPAWTPPYLSNLIHSMWLADPANRPDGATVVQQLAQHQNEPLQLTGAKEEVSRITHEQPDLFLASGSSSAQAKTSHKKEKDIELKEFAPNYAVASITSAKQSILFTPPSAAALSSAKQSVLFVPPSAASVSKNIPYEQGVIKNESK